jgi:hypothetical protein
MPHINQSKLVTIGTNHIVWNTEGRKAAVRSGKIVSSAIRNITLHVHQILPINFDTREY